jgi:hypothetical protein
MNVILAGQILGLAFACGLNLYLAVAALGLLVRFDLVPQLPPGLQGLEGWIVISSALTLFLVEAVVDKTRHVDSLWDTVHTFIRPPAAALLAIAALWARPTTLIVLMASAAFLVALLAHGTKAGLRLALNTTAADGRIWISVFEDLLALTIAVLAFLDPRTALIAIAVLVLLLLLAGPPYWRAVALGLRSLRAWLRSLFRPAGWREADGIPARIQRRLDPMPLGAAPPRAARAALDAPDTGAFRNGWLVLTAEGPLFLYRTITGARRLPLPPARKATGRAGPWTDTVHVETDDETGYTLHVLKDGPAPDLLADALEQP